MIKGFQIFNNVLHPNIVETFELPKIWCEYLLYDFHKIENIDAFPSSVNLRILVFEFKTSEEHSH